MSPLSPERSLDPRAGYNADTQQYCLPQSLLSDVFVDE